MLSGRPSSAEEQLPAAACKSDSYHSLPRAIIIALFWFCCSLHLGATHSYPYPRSDRHVMRDANAQLLFHWCSILICLKACAQSWRPPSVGGAALQRAGRLKRPRPCGCIPFRPETSTRVTNVLCNLYVCTNKVHNSQDIEITTHTTVMSTPPDHRHAWLPREDAPWHW